MKKKLILAVILLLWSSACFWLGAATSNIHARALTPAGNWAPLNIDSSGNLKVAAQ